MSSAPVKLSLCKNRRTTIIALQVCNTWLKTNQEYLSYFNLDNVRYYQGKLDVTRVGVKKTPVESDPF